jgi:DNA-binding XRE family transcriptional regulator
MEGIMVRLLRESRGWTQEHLALASCVSVRTIQRVEAGHLPSPETLLALSAVFNVEPAELQEEGPHVILDHKTARWPGCCIKVFRNGHQVPCCIEVDSRTRRFKRLGLLMLDVVPNLDDPEKQITIEGGTPAPPVTVKVDRNQTPEGAKRAIESWKGFKPPTYYVNGKKWVPEDNIVEGYYDAVVVVGNTFDIDAYCEEFPKHWCPVANAYLPRHKKATTEK